MKVNYRMQYHDVITNPRRRLITKIVMSAYLIEQCYNYDDIWYTESGK